MIQLQQTLRIFGRTPWQNRPDCGKRMRIADSENDLLVCPECGEEMRDFKPYIMWE